MEIDDMDWIALKADVTVLTAAFVGLLKITPARELLIAALRAEGRTAIEPLEKSGVQDVSQSALMQARAKLLKMIEF